MQDVADKISMLCSEFQTTLYVLLVGVVVLINGIGLMAGGEEGKTKVLKNLKWTVLGMIVVGGAITLGAQYGAKFKF